MMISLLKKLRMGAVRIVWALRALRYRLGGVRIGRRCVFWGAARFYRKPFAATRICLEDGVTLNSAPAVNHLITHPCSLSCIAPGAEIHLHRGCGLSGSTIVCSARVEVGENTVIGAGCVLYDAKEHDYSPSCGWVNHPAANEGRPIRIGNNCYIGMRCVILRGVSIGDNCVVSAGTVITRDMPAGHLASGNPAVYTPLSERLRTTASGIIPLPAAKE